jgi:hypothetical protein
MRGCEKIYRRFWDSPDIVSLGVSARLIPPPVDFSIPLELVLGVENLESTDV